MPALATLIETTWRGIGAALAPALRTHLRGRARKGKEVAARLGEREGRASQPRPAGTLIWLHAASVGETVSVLPVLARLVPHARVLLTTGTVTAAELFATRAPALGLADHVLHQFAPLDVPAWVNRFLDHWRPDAAVFVESELWPTQLAALRRRAVPLMLLNGRMSAASFRRWSRLQPVITPILGSFHTIWARGAEDARRFAALGREDTVAAGDLKLAAPALPADPTELASLATVIGARPVFVAASTHPGEEELVVAAHARLAPAHPGLLTIIVPRHPERGVDLAAKFTVGRRGSGAPPPDGGVWIADTLGELGLWYRLASVVFVGRSLIPPGGGQNPLEPARLGRAIVVGPHMGNFAEHMALLLSANAVRPIDGPGALADTVGALLADPATARAMGDQARQAVSGGDDLPERAARAILALAHVRGA